MVSLNIPTEELHKKAKLLSLIDKKVVRFTTTESPLPPPAAIVVSLVSAALVLPIASEPVILEIEADGITLWTMKAIVQYADEIAMICSYAFEKDGVTKLVQTQFPVDLLEEIHGSLLELVLSQ